MQPPVKIYALSTCGHCKAVKNFLNELGIKYEFTDIDLLEGDDRNSAIEEVRKLNAFVTLPTIVIGDKVIIGFQEEEIRKALGL